MGVIQTESCKQELISKLSASLYRYGIPPEELQATLTILMHDYDVTHSETALTVYNGDKNMALLQRFLIAKKVQGCTDRTINLYGNQLRRYLAVIGKEADAITSDDLMYFFASEMQRGLSEVAVENEHRILSSFFAWLLQEDIVVRNPMNRVGKMRHHKSKDKKAFSELEIETMRMHLKDARERAAFEMLLSTGCRVSELVSVRIEDVKNDTIMILGKGRKYRNVYLNARAMLAIRSYLDERSDANPYMFPKSSMTIGSREQIRLSEKGKENMVFWYRDPKLVHPSEPQDKGSIESKLRKLGKRSGVEGVYPHRFRRTCATFALRKGMPIELVSKMLGHESVATTQIYLDLSESDLKIAHQKYV